MAASRAFATLPSYERKHLVRFSSHELVAGKADEAFDVVRNINDSLSSLLPWGKAGVVASGMLVLDCVLHGLVLFITVIVCNL